MSAEQTRAITDAIDAAETAVAMVDDDSSDAVVAAADNAIMAAKSAIANADDLSAEVKAGYTTAVGTLETTLSNAKRSRMVAMDAAATEAAAAERKMAMNLHNVLGTAIENSAANRFAKPSDFDDKDLSDRKVHSVMGGTWESTYGDTPPDLMEADTNDRISASAFSTVGRKGHASTGLNGAGSAAFTTAGSYHGVAGQYMCVASTPNGCYSEVNASGNLVLGGGTWTFKPNNDQMRVTDPAATTEWGWWADTDEDGVVTALGVFTATSTSSASGLDSFGGSATYLGEALGKYAVYRGAGAENDSGDFTANAELKATFGNDASLSGMIDGFEGSDGEPRDWTVKLNKTTMSATGTLTPGATPEGTTVWTMGGVDGEAGGEWDAALYGQPEGSTNAVPTTALGTFEASHGLQGRMIGAFGATTEE